MPERMILLGRLMKRQGWVLCRSCAIRLLLRARVIRDVGHRVIDPQKPVPSHGEPCPTPTQGVLGYVYHTDISIYRRNSLIRPWLVQFACDQLLQCKDDTVFTSYPDCRASVLDCFDCIFYLDLALVKLGWGRRLMLEAKRTWKFRPSGEKIELPRSYPVPIDVLDVLA